MPVPSQDAVDAATDRVLVTGDPSGDDLTTMRAGLDAFAAAVSMREPVAAVSEERLPGRDVTVRTYRPGDEDDVVLLWFHGGGYVAGSLEAIDPVCRSLANRGSLTVVSVGYRLAPEHAFPAAYEDGLAALDHLSRVGRRLCVGGDSAGGGLAAAVARDWPGRLAALVLLCPFLDATLSCPSVRAVGTDYGLTEAALRGFVRLYGGDPLDPRVSPLLCPSLRGLPPTVVVTAEHDPLRDEAERYAGRVTAEGGAAHLRRWAGMVHGFAGMTAEVPEAIEALQWTADRVREVLRTKPSTSG